MTFRFTVFSADHADFAIATRLRQMVFCEEQGIDPTLEWDGEDVRCTHFLIWHDDDAIGTARLRPVDSATLKIERVAVHRDLRGSGVGRRLMRHVLDVIRDSPDLRYRTVLIHAQTAVAAFYRHLGFADRGAEFLEAGIPHVAMTFGTGATTPPGRTAS